MNLDAFFDELEKIGASGSDSTTNAYLAVGGFGGALAGAGAFIARRPMLRRQLSYLIKSIGKGGGYSEAKMKVPTAVVHKARDIGKYLKEQGVDPNKARIAVVGTGGTGKSTMAKALSEEMGMKARHLDDYVDSGKSLGEFVKANPVGKGTVAEQVHLLNQVNPDKFDAIIRLTTPMSTLKNQLLQRGHGAAQWDFFDYPLLHQTISNAFNLTAGAKKRFDTGVSVKVKPSTGFKSNKMIGDAARNAGIDIKGLDREQALASLASNAPVRSPGLLPFVRKGPLVEAVALTAGGGAVGAGAGHLVATQKRKP